MIATTDVAERVGAADTRLWTAWFEAVRSCPSNRYGIELRTAGDTVVMHCPEIPLSYYNRVMGLGARDCDRVEEVASYFAERETPFRVDMNPFGADDCLSAKLIARRLYPGSFQTSLYAELDALRPAAPQSGVAVREVRPDEVGFFARLYNRSYFAGERVPKRLARFREASVVARYAQPGWRHYLALVDGVPAGGALSYLDGDVATLAGAATVFTMRRRGVQAALLAQRLRDAADAGCNLVVSRCGVGSASQRNMERAGLRTAYTKVVWVQQGL